MQVIVAVVGARWPELSIEEEVLAPTGATLRSGAGATQEEILAVAGDADVILAGPRPVFDEATLERLACRGIVRYGVGVDNVDIDAASRLGKWVANVPDYGTEAVALHAATLALSAIRRVPMADRSLRRGDWGFAELRPLHLPESLIAGVIGFGRIGQRCAELLDAVGFARVLAHDPMRPVDHPKIEASPFEGVLAACDVVSLHAPGRQDGQPLLGEAELRSMKDGSVLVNTARGSLIDTPALAAGLAAGRPAVAALDVFEPEPPDLSPFANVADQLILTPHMAWYTEESERALRVKTAQEAVRLLGGGAPLHPIGRPGEAP